MSAPEFDNLWRPEAHPRREGQWLVTRYRYEDGKPVREVTKLDNGQPRRWDSEALAEPFASASNPVQIPAEVYQPSAVDLDWLGRFAEFPEGIVERSQHTVLLRLEHYGLVTSRQESNLRGRDRWNITDAGRAALAD